MAKIREIDFKSLHELIQGLNEREHCECTLKENGKELFPIVKKDGTIVFTNRLNTALMLFTAYYYEASRMHERLFLYLLVNQHIENGNGNGARLVLNELDEVLQSHYFHTYLFPNDVDFYLDYQAEAMLAHEYAHHLYQLNPERLDKVIDEIRDIVLSSNPGGINGFFGKYCIMKVLKDRHLMEEVACDCYAMAFITERLKQTDEDNIYPEHVLRQIIRLFISLRYLDEVQPPHGIHLIKEIKKYTFDFMRAVIVSYQLNKDWDFITANLLREEVRQYRQNQQGARKQLFNKLKYHHIRNIKPSFSTATAKNELEQILQEISEKEKWLTQEIRRSIAFRDYSYEANSYMANPLLSNIFQSILELNETLDDDD